MSYRTLRVHNTRQKALEKAAIEISSAIGKQYQWTDVARYMFDNLIESAKKGMIEDHTDDSAD